MRNLLFIHALTSVHPGSGTALGVVDLPVQRERHTQWPTIPASSIKGVLRDRCRNKGKDDPNLQAAFGPDAIKDDKNTFAGALSFTDARIIAYPVRSLKGVFAWITCPGALTRLTRDLAIKGHDGKTFDIPKVAENRFCSASDSPLLVNNKSIVLEEYDFEIAGPDTGVAEWVAENSVKDEDTKARIKKHLVILNDNDFTHFVRHSTEVVARIGLDHEKKTVKKGALFYQEFLPAETLFFSLVMAEDSRKPSHKMAAVDILGYLKSSLSEIIQIGGDETIGKGLCAVRFLE